MIGEKARVRCGRGCRGMGDIEVEGRKLGCVFFLGLAIVDGYCYETDAFGVKEDAREVHQVA